MHEEVRKYADSNDIKGLRYIFVDCLDVDPTFEEYAEDFEYCKKKAGLFEPHRELMPMTENQKLWNDDYWVQLKMDLLKNFSHERFEHMRQVALVYYAEKIARITKEREEQKERERQLEERNRQVMQKRGQSQNESPQEIELVQGNITGDVESTGSSQREEQERRLAEKRRQLEQERQRSLERERREKEQLERRRADDRKTTSSSMENFDPKKVLGAAFIIVIIVIIILIVVAM